MTHSDPPRPYRKTKRALQEEETRRRITEAVMELHSTVGPARTTVTDVAALAGVSRMTVYNHFPTDSDLIEACSTHWAALNPSPDPSDWSAVQDPRTRMILALGELYRFYRRTEDMLGNVLRDAPLVPPLGDVMESRWSPYLDRVVDALSRGWDMPTSSRRDFRALVRVAVDFATWKTLVGTGMEDAGAAALAARMVAATVGSASSTPVPAG